MISVSREDAGFLPVLPKDRDQILFEDGDIMDFHSTDKMKKVSEGIGIKYIGNPDICIKLQKRLKNG